MNAKSQSPELTCPGCGKPMSANPFQGMEVDFCAHCGGFWFDRGELSQAVSGATPDQLAEQVEFNSTTPSRRYCPQCRVLLSEVNLSELDIRVDKCLACDGLYLDRGEFKKGKNLFQHRRNLLSIQARHLQQSKPQHAKIPVESDDTHLIVSGESDSEFVFQFLTGLPLELDSKQKLFSPVITCLIVINAALLISSLFRADMITRFGMVPNQIMQGETLFTLISSMFLHGGILHFLGNMYFLFVAGDDVEEAFGIPFFIFAYVFGGLAASALHIAFDPTSTIPCVGASGAISAVLGSYFAMFPGRRFLIRWFYFWTYNIKFTIPAWAYLGFWFILQIVYASFGLPGVAWYAHAGGFFAGIGLAVSYHLVTEKLLD